MVDRIEPGSFLLETNKNLGAVEIMTFLSLILLGISFSLGYTFFKRSGGDRFSLKFLVSTLLFLEIFHSFTASQTVYYETVTRWNRGEANSYPLSINVLSENLITFLVQWFFSHRIYRLSGSLLLSLACLSFAFLRFVGGIALSVESILDVPRNPNGVFVFTFRWLVISALAVGAAADVLIAISMVYHLRQLASPHNLKSTTAALNRLVRWTLQTGIVTSMTSVTVIICFIAMSNMIWFALYIVLAKLSILAREWDITLKAQTSECLTFSLNNTVTTFRYPYLSIPCNVASLDYGVLIRFPRLDVWHSSIKIRKELGKSNIELQTTPPSRKHSEPSIYRLPKSTHIKALDSTSQIASLGLIK